jgi:hypothetical protein
VSCYVIEFASYFSTIKPVVPEGNDPQGMGGHGFRHVGEVTGLDLESLCTE